MPASDIRMAEMPMYISRQFLFKLDSVAHEHYFRKGRCF